MKLQFFHKRGVPTQYTVAAIIPDDIANCDVGDMVVLEVGVAHCHSKDLFNKKIGRNVATGRMVKYAFMCSDKHENVLQFVTRDFEYVLSIRGSHLIAASIVNFHI